MSSPLPIAPIDPLGQALHFLRMSSGFYCRSELSAPYGLELPPMEDCLSFHIVTAGRGWLEVAGEPPMALQRGDMALVPHGKGHRLVSEVRADAHKLFDLPREEVSERYEILRLGGGGEATTMLCGAVYFDHPAASQLLRLLPPVIQVDGWSASEGDWLQSTMRFIASEAEQLRPGGETIITRLCDILVIQAIRSWLARDPAAQTGWLGALQDDQIGRAVTRIHTDPTHPWTVADLARLAALSRSAFAARFTELVGETPMRYVARWRMHTALGWLKEEPISIREVASRLGYQSEAAFNRAFKRCFGLPPGAARKQRA